LNREPPIDLWQYGIFRFAYVLADPMEEADQVKGRQPASE